MAVVFPDNTLTLIVVNVEHSYATETAHCDLLLQYQEFYESPSRILANLLHDHGLRIGQVGLETDHMPADDLMQLREVLPPSVEFTPCGVDVLSIREQKLDWEIEQIRRAATVTTLAYESLTAKARTGWTEKQVAEHLSGVCYEEGVDQARVIVGSGARSLHANATPTSKIIERGDVIRMDLLCQVNGYWADVARTMAAGAAPDSADQAWQELIKIHRSLIDQVRAGVQASTIHQQYSHYMQSAALKTGLSFLGHGLGLTLHEEPYMRRGNDRLLLRSSVLCLEPYVLGDTFALHVEDEVLIDLSGESDVLTDVPQPSPLPRLG